MDKAMSTTEMSAEDLMREKVLARARVISCRDEIPAEERERRSAALCARLVECCAGVLRPGTMVAAYCAFGSEPDMKAFVHEAYARGCRVCFPCMVRAEAGAAMAGAAAGGVGAATATGVAAGGASAEAGSACSSRAKMTFLELDQAAFDAKEAAFLCKPVRSIPADDALFETVRVVPADEIDVVVVPMVACDTAGNRLGYGGGNYDRFLETVRDDALIIGVGFAEQQVDAVPCEPHDKTLPRIELG